MSSANDEAAIREAINCYAEGVRTASVGTLKQAFHPQAICCGYLGDELYTVPIQGLYDWVESNPAPAHYDCSVLKIEITKRVAAATISETEPPLGDWIDYFHLLKDGDKWWIVSKLWDEKLRDAAE